METDFLTYQMFSAEQIRDYIHVMDLADGHIAALKKLFATENIGSLLFSIKTLLLPY